MQIASDPKWLGLVRGVVGQSCLGFGAREELATAVVLAVNEAVANVMRHGYAGDTEQPIWITCRLAGPVIEVRICDHGIEAEFLAQQPPPPDELRVGGRGVFMIRALMDEIEYRREDGRNRLCLRKHLLRQEVGR
ncbi:MAG: ATP-binding protein [Bryobacterales bacterium]|nr:ATP-binding protein [Bryobacterales bacterium]